MIHGFGWQICKKDLHTEGRIILKLGLKETSWRAGARFVWLRTQIGGRFREYGSELPCSMKRGGFN